jgi:hypothetical protein
MLKVAMALIFVAAFALPAAAQETWCWAPEVNAQRTSWTCTYTLPQCQEIVRLRRTGICVPAQRY